MKVLGIDPGVTGGWALVNMDTSELTDGGDLPTQAKTTGRAGKELDILALNDLFNGLEVHRVVLELAQPMPKQGVVSVFAYGRSFGQLEAMILGRLWSLHYAPAATWKRKAGLIGQSKAASIALARRIFPNAAAVLSDKNHHVAEAALLAWYG